MIGRQLLYILHMDVVRRIIENPAEIERIARNARSHIAQEAAKSKGEEEEAIRVERHGDQLYLYTKNTDEFLAQGSTLQEALARIEQRYPDRKFRGYLSREEADDLGVTVK
ncbi:MAG: hypothetical protein EBT86_13565 [Actinobacteria bacterium]|nr:hypothetical protein [Actinomycetota bacterium]